MSGYNVNDDLGFVAIKLARRLDRTVNWTQCRRDANTRNFIVTDKNNNVKMELDSEKVVAQATLENPTW